ncbi:hypothetical protein IscW_ISCW015694 [Ixodes scapularis]|uniref:Uncharacterized protein n=1 Tax=Ixodes scapularis TaxID=6945 RepID=B7P0X9_IXOSC|nr:hypothetical protein IscW_ISCW015694 [Ixodes scapularis]|eukprot:XP_002399693.1 hypothetical protein IscW_ISCW015694 [Ixodes scapularis]
MFCTSTAKYQSFDPYLQKRQMLQVSPILVPSTETATRHLHDLPHQCALILSKVFLLMIVISVLICVCFKFQSKLHFRNPLSNFKKNVFKYGTFCKQDQKNLLVFELHEFGESAPHFRHLSAHN